MIKQIFIQIIHDCQARKESLQSRHNGLYSGENSSINESEAEMNDC